MRPIAIALALLAALAAGCHTAPSDRFENPSTFATIEAASVETVARDVLMELRFEPIVPEKSKGFIETYPLTGASWFEFWRKDTRGAYQSAEASLHTVRRRATVAVSPKDAGSQVVVRVVKERLSAPGTSPESIGQSLNLYDVEDTDLVRRDALAETETEWISLGRDHLLEQYILEQIHARLH